MLGSKEFEPKGKMGYSKVESSDKQKKLANLKTQLYGKDTFSNILRNVSIKKAEKEENPNFFVDKTASKQSIDSSYLKNDLLRILILATFAIGTQLILFFAVNSGIIKLPI